MRPTCLFCAKTSLAEEPILPHWLAGWIPAGNERLLETHVHRQYPTVFRQHEMERPRLVLRSVCAACHRRWIREREAGARAPLQALVQGESIDLSVADQTAIAAWAVFKAFSLNSAQVSPFRLDDQRLQWLRSRPAPPPDTGVWLANAQRAGTWRSFTLGIGDARDPTGHSDVASWVAWFGRLVFHVVVDPGHSASEPWTHPFGRHATRRIWPIEAAPCAWPPSRGLVDEGIERMHRCMLPPGLSSHPTM